MLAFSFLLLFRNLRFSICFHGVRFYVLLGSNSSIYSFYSHLLRLFSLVVQRGGLRSGLINVFKVRSQRASFSYSVLSLSSPYVVHHRLGESPVVLLGSNAYHRSYLSYAKVYPRGPSYPGGSASGVSNRRGNHVVSPNSRGCVRREPSNYSK